MTVIIFDYSTGEVHEVSVSVPLFYFTEGNGSCDCNREWLCGHKRTASAKFCIGCKRYVIVGASDLEDAPTDDFLNSINEDYPKELVNKAVEKYREYKASIRAASSTTP